jgi:hypothetical protein
MFDEIYDSLSKYLTSAKKLKVMDASLLRQLIFTFYSNAVREIENIRKKMDSDQKYQIQLTEKALHQYNQLLKHEQTLER